MWYADDPKFGSIHLYVSPQNNYAWSFIYSPKIVADRLGKRMNQAYALELSLGPMGLISRRYYLEAGFSLRTPLKIRLIAIMDAYDNTSDEDADNGVAARHDAELTEFILSEWKKVYIED